MTTARASAADPPEERVLPDEQPTAGQPPHVWCRPGGQASSSMPPRSRAQSNAWRQ